jgi:hypothetical protein
MLHEIQAEWTAKTEIEHEQGVQDTAWLHVAADTGQHWDLED